jgi:hypothetical protein
MLRTVIASLGMVLLFNVNLVAEEDFKPDQSKLLSPAPEDATVLLAPNTNLFLSKTGDKIDWPLEKGIAISSRGQSRSNHIVSKLHFRDADIHVEFMLPEKTKGNSGVYIHGNYELQIIKSFGKEKLNQQDAGGIYGFAKPLVSACKKQASGKCMTFDSVLRDVMSQARS